MEAIIRQLLAHQNPAKKHTLLTRLVISAIIIFANTVLYGAYGVIAAIITYLVFVAWFGLHLLWMFVPLVVMLLYSIARSVAMLVDYWRNHGQG